MTRECPKCGGWTEDEATEDAECAECFFESPEFRAVWAAECELAQAVEVEAVNHEVEYGESVPF